MKVLVSVRLDSELLAWADRYAASLSTPEKRITRTAVIDGGLKHLRELAAGGVPDLPTSEPEPQMSDRIAALRGRR